MMGKHEEQKELFSYQVDLDKRGNSKDDMGVVRRGRTADPEVYEN